MAYWSIMQHTRLSRRRGLALAGSGAAAALLAACGGGGDSGSKANDRNSLVTKIEDTTKQATPGGALKRYVTVDPPNIDPYNGPGTASNFVELIYSRPAQIRPGNLQGSAGEVIPELVESWEWSPDLLQLTMKLRQNVKFQNLPPVSGRTIDIDDVRYSWKRFSETGAIRSSIVNALNPASPITSVTFPDDRTFVFKLKEPIVFMLDMLTQRQLLNIIPKEGEGRVDLAKNPIGSGPYYLASHQASSRLEFKKHDGYWNTSTGPFIDSFEYPVVPEYAAGLAQFKAGNIHTFNVRGDDVFATKGDVPQLALYQDPVPTMSLRTAFGYAPQGATKSPFLDERVRQAYSMALDRDLFIDVVYNTTKFKQQGLPVETRWNTGLPATVFEGWWLDPKGKDFGPNAKYFEHNPAEAKKLLASAGFADGLSFQSYVTKTGLGDDLPKWASVLEGMAADAGFKANDVFVDYITEFIPNYRDSEGKFTGISYKSGPLPVAFDPVAYLQFDYYSKVGVSWYGYDVKGVGDRSGDPYVDGLLVKGQGEVDNAKRRAIVHDLQRYLGKSQYGIRFPGSSTSFSLLWPAVKNYNAFRSPAQTRVSHLTWWLDRSLPPFK
ncbi:MAG TPA: ABC transporter substrate-binding protein [Dehalococcoidia bacterium]|nr:ABC transporter substrate-binding protein [Dehalococcoidia bacterium]